MLQSDQIASKIELKNRGPAIKSPYTLVLICNGLAQHDLKHNWAWVHDPLITEKGSMYSNLLPLFLAQLCLKSYIVMCWALFIF